MAEAHRFDQQFIATMNQKKFRLVLIPLLPRHLLLRCFDFISIPIIPAFACFFTLNREICKEMFCSGFC